MKIDATMSTTDPALRTELECLGNAPGLNSFSASSGGKSSRPALDAPLRLKTHNSARGFADHAPGIEKSPEMRNNRPSSSSTSNQRLNTVSPKTERLPSFRQLSRIASVGEGETRASPTYPPPPSSYHNPAPSHSPIPQPQHSQHPQHPQHPQQQHPQQQQQQQHFFQAPQISPVTGYGYPQASPTSSMQSDPYFSNSPPPATFSSSGYYTAPTPRRPTGPLSGPPASLPSLTSTASSGSSGLSYQNSATDGYSSATTTPFDSTTSVDSAGRISLPSPMTVMPPPQPMTGPPGTFACSHPGCNAPPFQTQYLLNSHANVHSSDRPHYCPVSGCPRAEGGKGFKRKNEMIRHGLVHDSPGYMCPFCPDREHRYPRPDNLQRHVRVHHIDKDKDDPALREVLNQRAEGARSRRRRTGP